VFEDEKCDCFFPLTFTRAIFELRCGYISLLERIKRNFPQIEIGVFLRDYLVPTFKKRVSISAINDLNFITRDDVLFLNGRWLMKYGEIPLEGEEKTTLKDGEIVCIRAKRRSIEENKADTLPGLLNKLKNSLPKEEIDTILLSYPWELVNQNPETLKRDFAFFGNKGIYGNFAEYAAVYGEKDKVFVAETAEIQPFVLLDTTDGPIYIDEGVKIHSHTRVEGPSYIGRDSIVVGAKIREGTSIGPVCRVGGEVGKSIFHGYSNKSHHGYIGRSYIGEWVNLGALTTNSDLKNDYTPVRVYIKDKAMLSNEVKVGVFVGDHTKTGIGVLLPTGGIVGMMCNILPAAGKLIPKFIPSFTCFFKNEFGEGKGLKHSMEAVRTAMLRRGIELSGEDVELFNTLYELTRKEREGCMSSS
jgi:UDP-N-acetylglucosamine diphosphorylase/glucosamine-1-phosphate N-acetyltransferase